MNIINKILTVLFCALLFVACGDDENLTVIPQGPTTTVHTYSAPLIGNTQWELSFTDTLRLADMIGEDAALNIIKSKTELQYDNTYLQIKGLKDVDSAIELRNLKLTVGGKVYNLGTAAGSGTADIISDEKYSTQEVRNMMDRIFSELLSSKRRAILKLSYDSTEDFEISDDITFNLVFNLKYSWNTYTKN